MAENSLADKLKLKPGSRAAILNPPDGYLDEMGALPDGVELASDLQGQFDWIQVFFKNKAEIDARIADVIKALKPTSLLWISFPKGSSRIQTDLTRDQGWDAVQSAGLKWINLVSVNETWSAFSLRPYRPGELRQSFR
jgi:hypothetical protein